MGNFKRYITVNSVLIDYDLNGPLKNSSDQDIVVGCNYHTNWQKHPAMRFVLSEVKGDKARLTTRGTRKDFWTDVDSLIFIKSKHNKRKANKILNQKNGNN